MSVSEATLFILMQNFPMKSQRVLMLEKYVQKYGPLSADAWEKIIELIKEGLDERKPG